MPEGALSSRLGELFFFGWSGAPPPIHFSFFFYSTFSTSLWLWLYGLGVVGSRLLVRLGAGAGAVLRATDLERQPVRSLGFVVVLGLTLLFALGLPFVLMG